MRLTTRADLNVGYSCNLRCKFCYYQQTLRDDTKVKDLDTATVKKQLAYLRRNGIDTVDFTGGEPTMRSDLLDLVGFARSIGFKSVCVISNGLRLSQAAYAKECVQAGVDDFLISIHGHEASVHDGVTERPGSFRKAVEAVRALSAHPVKIRTNCVISRANYQNAVEAAAFFHGIGISTVNFILFNPIVEAGWRSSPDLDVAYSDAAPPLKAAIDEFGGKLAKLTVRYIPFCLMRGYESHVTNMPQIQYDPDEWDYLVRTVLRRGKSRAVAALALGFLLHPSKLRALARGPRIVSRESIKFFLQRKNKRYGPACRKCSLRRICDGLWSRYADWRGFDELQAVPGPLISDPTHFLRQTTASRKSG